MGNRPERVGDQIRVELTDLLTREVHDPGIGFVTITRVKVSPDLLLARVYYTSLGDEKAQRESGKALKRAMPFLRRQIGQRIQLRRVPELQFFYDESIAHQDRIERILQDLHQEAEQRERSALGTPASERVGGAGPPSPRSGFGEVSPEPARPSSRAEADGAKPSGVNDYDTDDSARKD